LKYLLEGELMMQVMKMSAQGLKDLPTARSAWKAVTAFGVAVGVVGATLLAGRTLPESVTTDYPWARQAVSQGLLAVFAIGDFG
jgi:hypothetical protein